MKIIQLLFGKPGLYLYLMFIWVLLTIPGGICIVRRYNVNLHTFMLFMNIHVIPYILCIIVAMILNLVNLFTGYWDKIKYVPKYFILIGSYAVTAWLADIFTLLACKYGYVIYIGDLYGTIVMGYLPTIVLYAVGGIPLTIYLSFRKQRKANQAL
jgi:hypothetical protein